MIDIPALLLAIQVGTVACLVYLLGTYALAACLLLLAVVENFARSRENRDEDYGLLSTSPFTIPVSVIAGAHNEEVMILPVVRAFLAFTYPQFEVILVNDGSTDRTLDRLREEYQLERREVFYRRVLPSAEVRAVYRSRRDPRLVVVDKAKGGKADALNCAVNCVALKDPARVIAVTGSTPTSS